MVRVSPSWVKERLRSTYLAARATDQLPRFLWDVSRAIISRSTVRASYRIEGIKFSTEHRGVDGRTFEEIFVERLYDLPGTLAQMVPSKPSTVLDLGGNVGYFSLWAELRWNAEKIVAFEPDPANAERYRELKSMNGLSWDLVEAFAATRDGSVRFATGRLTSGSKVMDGFGAEIEAVDVFPYMADADIVKMDIEGAEWDLLSDKRMSELKRPAIVLEYHRHACPGEDPHDVAIVLLTDHGFKIHELFYHEHLGVGMLWAYRV